MKKAFIAIGLAVVAMMAGSNAFGQSDEENGLKRVYKYGYQDASGKMVIPLQYYNAGDFSEGLAAVEETYDSEWGYIDEKGKMVIKPQYEYAGEFSSGLAAVRVDGKYGYIDKNGKMVIQLQFDEATSFSGNIASVRIGDYWTGKWGCIDKTGKMVIQPQYEDALYFQNGLVAMVESEKKIINNKGKTIVELPGDASCWFYDSFKDGWGRVSVNSKFGLLDENGWVLPPQYDDAYVYGDVACVSIGDWSERKTGIVDKKGKWIQECREDVDLQSELDGTLCVRVGDKFGFLNGKGWIIEPQYDNAGYFREDLISVKVGDVWGFADKTGKICIKPKYESVTWEGPEFLEGLALVGFDDKAGFIDKKGNWVIQPQYEDALDFSEGLAAVYDGEKWGFIDKTGKMVIQPQYEGVGYFSEGMALVKVGDKYGYIDKTGKMVIKPQFSDADSFEKHSGKAWVRLGDYETGKNGYVDKTGKFEPFE